ncbi:MAG: GvpL/GvpF family gas vesicle protein [candidate division Zixibacteria bacterium]|nr:GvpL/GvpF family gas vesicle protein [candidate division Zixibacteria bacterium]
MSEQGKYIYGIIQANEKKSFGPIGLGNPKKEVYTVPYQDISAVVSDSPIVPYHSMTKDKTVKDLFCHQSVIEKVMKNHAIIPIKFGTFAEGEKEVARILKTGYEQFKKTLALMNNKIELDVMALWNKEIVFKEIAEEKEIKEFKQKTISNLAGPQLDDRIKLGRMVEKSLKKRNLEYKEEILCVLGEKAFDFCTHDTLDDTMILNSSFLLDGDREDFDKRLNEVDEKYKNKINFRCVGPLPPYSFSTIEVKKIGFEAVDKARKLLGLEGEITPKKIKNAHRELVFKYHPDKNPQGSSFDKEFNEVTQAYKLLLEYCQSDRCSLRKENFKDFILIKISRIAEQPERKKY